MVKRFLVTTPLEDTWPAADVPVLFLGEWARLYDRKLIWEKRDSIVASYHWDDREKLHKDYLYLQALYEELLSELTLTLNVTHGVNYSIRYWRIVIGPWLGYFMQMLFDRWAMLKLVIHDYSIGCVMVIREGGYRFVPNDMADFESLYVTDAWNEMIYGQLLAFMTVPIKYVEAVIHRSNKPKKSCDGQIKRSLHKLVDNTLNRFVRNDECFFISSYLPIKQALCLQFRLAQLPKFWHSTALPKITSDTNKRKWDKIAPENIDDFSEVVRYMIPRHIPLAYLEGYHKLLTLTEKLPWPKQPKVIFTSNSYNSDDVFKVWTAEKVEMGSKLIIGQHGGYFGMGRWCFAEDHQLAISDRFITWGWAEPEKLKVFPVGNIKGLGKSVKCSKGGLALLVQVVHPRYSYWMYGTPISGQWLDYFEDQYRFANALPSKHQDQLLVRLYAQDYGWCQKQRWLDRFPKINIDDGIKSMESLIKESRLYISTYNATTYLESMSLNIPTIIFWNPKYWELRDSAVPYFEKLKSVGIFHETPESAAKQMSVVWDDVAGWWEDQAVQAVRKEFCDRYARIPEKPLKMMENLFREVAGST